MTQSCSDCSSSPMAQYRAAVQVSPQQKPETTEASNPQPVKRVDSVQVSADAQRLLAAELANTGL